jgi:transcriptional regulator of acetoin/glycerol metabolism
VELDFSLICATHCKLREQAEKGKFRYDLYYRINGLTVQLPALRERDDFQALTTQILRRSSPDVAVSVDLNLLKKLRAHSWPGNLRQYSNVLGTAVAMLDAGEKCIDMQHLPDDIVEEMMLFANTHNVSSLAKEVIKDVEPQNLEHLERNAIERALADSGGNMSQAARSLGISRQTLYRKIVTIRRP